MDCKYDAMIDISNINDSHSSILRQVRSGSVILEFGPANGAMTKYMRDVLNCKVYIVEIDKKAGKIAANYAVDHLFGDIEQYEWLNKYRNIKFDYIIFADVLEHLHNPEKVLLSSKELLKEDGSVLISIPNIGHNAVVMSLVNNEFEYRELGFLDRTHIHFFTYNSLERMLDRIRLYPVKRLATYAEAFQTEFENNYDSVTGIEPYFWKTRQFGNVNQFIYELKQTDVLKDIQYFLLDVPKSYFLQLFLDDGNGSNENKTLIKYLDLRNKHVVLSFELDGLKYKNDDIFIRKIRLDPLNTNCIVKINYLYYVSKGEKTELKVESSNADFVYQGVYFFSTVDPQLSLSKIDKAPEIIYLDLSFEKLDSGEIIDIINHAKELEERVRQEYAEELERVRDGMQAE
jgi:2-polyprenyl-3-methyl-5-hydroxy-6-metoxy-1,4-benzoquinol methylase